MKFLTHSKVQVQFASVFLVWFVALMVAFVFIFVWNFRGASDRTEGMLIHDQLITKLLLLDQTKELALWYGAAAFAYIALIWAYVIVYSHRMTGPVYKLTQMLENARETGEWPQKVVFRKSDAFPELAEAFNQFVESKRGPAKPS